MGMIGLTLDQIKMGQTAEFAKTISETDIYLFAGISGDFNPAHVNEAYARKTFFKTRIAHGMLSASFISTVLASKLPGPGAIYIKQELRFVAPVHIGETITARVEVIEIFRDKNRLRLKTNCTNQKDELVIEGEALVSPPKSA
jgi:3-hydroxybutyryl-CoA dehydratase